MAVLYSEIPVYRKSVLFLIILMGCNYNYCEGNPDSKNGLNVEYSGSKIKRIYELQSCNLNGISIHFHPNGKIKKYGYGIHGKAEGYWSLFDSTGKYQSLQVFQNGELVKVTDLNEQVIFDSKDYVLTYKQNHLDLSRDSLIRRSHFSDFFIKVLSPDKIIFESEQKILTLNSNLEILHSQDNLITF